MKARERVARRNKALVRGDHVTIGEFRAAGLLQTTDEHNRRVATHIARVEVVAIAEKLHLTLRIRLYNERDEIAGGLDFRAVDARALAGLIAKTSKTTAEIEIATMLGLLQPQGDRE